MTKQSFRIATIALSAAFLLLCHSRTFTQTGVTRSSSISDLAWMVGDWQTDSGELTSDEHWAGQAGEVMIGMSRSVSGDKLISFEALRIEQRKDAIFYVASVNGGCLATHFKLTRLTAQEAVFENPAHDFPKRIIYRKKSATEMTATIDAGEGTPSHAFIFHLSKNK
jgi:hypothetical protein